MEDNGTRADRRRDCVVLVHGTWGRQSSWMKPGSPLRAAIGEAVGASADCLEFEWSGRNRHGDRRVASVALARWLRGPQMRAYGKVHLVAHSHGGNIAMRASWLAGAKVGSLVTVGTPFIRAEEREEPLSHILRMLIIPLTYLVLLFPMFFGAIYCIWWLSEVMLNLGISSDLPQITMILSVILLFGSIPAFAGLIATRITCKWLKRTVEPKILRTYRRFTLASVPTNCIFDARDEARLAIWSSLTSSATVRAVTPKVLGLCVLIYFIAYIIFRINPTSEPEAVHEQTRVTSYLGPFESLYGFVFFSCALAAFAAALFSPVFSIAALGVRSAWDLLFVRIHILNRLYGEAVVNSPVRIGWRRSWPDLVRLRHSRLCHDDQVVAIIVGWLGAQICCDSESSGVTSSSDLSD